VKLDSLKWAVHTAGYTIQRGEDSSNERGIRRHVEHVVPNGSALNESYSPLAKSHARLYRLFAAIKSEEGIIRFADDYGLLERDALKALRQAPGQEPEQLAEAVQRWRDEIHAMNTALCRWDYLQGRTNTMEGAERAIVSHRFLADIGQFGEGSPIWKRKVRVWILRKLKEALAEKLERHCGFTVTMDADSEPPLQIEPAPRTLLGVAWYQAARAISAREDYFLCPTCQTNWVEPNEIGRPRRFCSESCKVRAHQKRSQHAALPRKQKGR
jgi:hypothetical protein